MSAQNNTPTDGELKFQVHAITKMMERMNLMMGNVVTDLRRWENMVTWLEYMPKT